MSAEAIETVELCSDILRDSFSLIVWSICSSFVSFIFTLRLGVEESSSQGAEVFALAYIVTLESLNSLLACSVLLFGASIPKQSSSS